MIIGHLLTGFSYIIAGALGYLGFKSEGREIPENITAGFNIEDLSAFFVRLLLCF